MVSTYLGKEDVETTHAWMTVRGEIEIAIRTEGGEHLIAWGVDGFAQILHAHESSTSDARAPDVHSALATRHIANKIQPHAIRRNSWMSKGGEGVARDDDLLRFAPRSIAATGLHNLGIARIGTIVEALGEVHLTTIGGNETGTLIIFGIETAAHCLWPTPLALIVTLREENVRALGASDGIQFVTFSIVASG